MPKTKLKYQRVLLKISGEALMGKREFGLDPGTIGRIAGEIKSVVNLGMQVCLVVGGGNIYRGATGVELGMDRVTGDYMGMLGTVINALAMQAALEKLDIPTRVQSALKMEQVCEPYIRRKAIRHMEKGRVVIFAAGLGSPYFTTDTTSTLRASEMECDILLKATKVDGVYDSDPRKNPKAKRYDRLSFDEAINKNLAVMDATAFTLARDNNLPIGVFSIDQSGAFAQAAQGRGKFTLISKEA
jgi:uridylate kinase